MSIVITSTGGSSITITTGSLANTASNVSTTDAGYANAQEELTAHEQAIADIPTTLADLSEDTTHRTVTDSEIAAWDALKPETGVTFTGEISLGKLYTQYATYTPASNLAVTLNATKVIGGGADIRMVGNGVNTPTFAAFTKHPSSGDYVNTLNTVNYIVFYFNGTESLYSINQL